MDYPKAVAAHEEWRFLHDIATYVDDRLPAQPRGGGRRCGQRRVAQKEGMALVDHALAHLGAEQGNPGLVDEAGLEAGQDLRGSLAVGGDAHQQQGSLACSIISTMSMIWNWPC